MNHDLGIRGLLAAYASGERAPIEVLRAAHARARASDQPAWITLLDWDAVAEHVDRLGPPTAELPLYGIPFAIKDNVDLAGVPTTAACPEFAAVPQHSAFVVDRLIAAGAIPLGKTNMDQFATGLVGTRTPYGACRSVIDERYISGGSSSGSAVVVAAGMVSFALGTDTAGSGRVPAAFNAIVGLKPSLGLLSTRGVLPACRTLDCVSVFALDVVDAARVCAAAAAYDVADPYSRRVAPPGRPARGQRRIGVPPDAQMRFFGDRAAAAAWQIAVEHAAGLGWELIEIDFEPFAAAAGLLYDGGWIAERSAAVGEFVAARPDAVDPVVAEIIGRGTRPSAVDAFRSAYRLAELRRATQADWERIDALLLPTAPTIFTHAEIRADPIGTNAVLGTYTNFVNLMDLSAIAVPAPVRDDGLPFGVTLVGRRDQDGLLIDLAGSWLGEDQAAIDAELGSPTRSSGPSPGETLLAVVGAHLSGLPLNHQLTELGATLAAQTLSAPIYRLYALAGTVPAKPGLVRAADGDSGESIEVEVWRISHAGLGRLIGGVGQPLSIGAIELIDGTTVSGFVCDSRVITSARDITDWGGWRAFVAGGPPAAVAG
ncbi:MAG TPA: allophanate hydrolase [Solirubrobacteraceae bacterium]|jgi:allophanate hydrolase|nr:allophanate hydrolase [Solirubrobacteraceae bacterium]